VSRAGPVSARFAALAWRVGLAGTALTGAISTLHALGRVLPYAGEVAWPDYSIVVPAYNEESLLPTTLDRLRAAMEAVRQWKFVAAKLNGKAVASQTTVIVRFQLAR